MGIKITSGNLLESDAHTLINTVNCVGVMGKGIALDFKKRFPTMFRDYAERCQRREVRLGKPYLYTSLIDQWVLNFPTKDHWRSLTRLSDVIEGLEYLERHYLDWGIKSLAVPPLGCGNGQLEWRVVGPTLYRYLSRLEIPVELYAPIGTPHIEMTKDFLLGQHNLVQTDAPEKIKPGWLAIAEIVDRINSQPFHRSIGRVMLQKIAFVATTLGIPTELSWERNSYGPFSKELKKVESKLINNGLLHEQKLGNGFRITTGSTFPDALQAYSRELSEWELAIESTSDLFMRIQDSRQAELVASIMYVANSLKKDNEALSEIEVFNTVSTWKARRNPPHRDTEIAETIRGLASRAWIEVEPSDELPIDGAFSLV